MDVPQFPSPVYTLRGVARATTILFNLCFVRNIILCFVKNTISRSQSPDWFLSFFISLFLVLGTGFWTSILSLVFWIDLSQITRFWTYQMPAAVLVLKR